MPELSWAAVVTWLIDHGIRILIIVVVAAVLWFALNKFLPPIMGRLMTTTKGESKEGIKKRKDTLVGILGGSHRLRCSVLDKGHHRWHLHYYGEPVQGG